MALKLPSTISSARAVHILYGDAGGGGHAAAAAKPGHSAFPASWSDQTIIDTIADIACDATMSSRPGRFGRTIREDVRNGVRIRVVVDGSGQVVTGFPI